MSNIDPADVHGCIYHASLLLTNHLRAATEIETSNSLHNAHSSRLLPNSNLNCLRPLLPANSERIEINHDNGQSPRKKRKLVSSSTKHEYDTPDPAEALPSRDVIETVVTQYFATIHHWLPMIHERRLRARLNDAEESKDLHILIHAMIATALRHVKSNDARIAPEEIHAQVRISTNVVVLNAFDSKCNIDVYSFSKPLMRSRRTFG